MIYEKLIDLAEQLESMISDGVQLIHGGNLALVGVCLCRCY